MQTVRMRIDVGNAGVRSAGRVDIQKVEATAQAEIARHKSADDAEAMRDAAKYARRVRLRLR